MLNLLFLDAVTPAVAYVFPIIIFIILNVCLAGLIVATIFIVKAIKRKREKKYKNQ